MRIVVRRHYIPKPSNICFVPGSSSDPDTETDHGGGLDDFPDPEECDALYITEKNGRHIWRVRLGDALYSEWPELIYQSWKFPTCSRPLDVEVTFRIAQAIARADERLHVRAIVVDQARRRMFWFQGDCLMCAPLKIDEEVSPDKRADVWFVENGMERVSSPAVDDRERWLLLKQENVEVSRLFLGNLFARKFERVGPRGAGEASVFLNTNIALNTLR